MTTNGERAQWARVAIDRWLGFFYDLRHFIKRMQDTPPDLRGTFVAQPWFAIAVALGLFLIVSAYWSLR